MIYQLVRRTQVSIAVRPMFSETRTGAIEHIRRHCGTVPEQFTLKHGSITFPVYRWLSYGAKPGQTFKVK